MIIDKLENIAKYLPDNQHGKATMEFIKNNDLSALNTGRYDIDDSTFVNVVEYQTKPAESVVLEGHIKYVDVQLILDGAESANYAVKQNQPVAKQYDAQADYQLYQVSEYSTYTVEKGEFAVLFPPHLHQFGLPASQPSTVKKAIFKIPVWEN